MNKIIACLISMFFLSSCASSSEEIYLQQSNCRINAGIFKDSEGYKLEMVFKNESQKNIRLQNPECLNQNVLVNVYSSSGEKMSQKVPVKSASCDELVLLEPGASRTFVLPFTLDYIYGLNKPGKYKVFFEYVGDFYEDSGIMYGEPIIKSPTAEFAVK